MIAEPCTGLDVGHTRVANSTPFRDGDEYLHGRTDGKSSLYDSSSENIFFVLVFLHTV